MGVKGIILAVEAGICAAMASVSAKLASSYDSAIELAAVLCNLVDFDYQIFSRNQLLLTIRLMSVVGIVGFNALMWVLFTKSMHQCSSTLEATTFNLSSNFIFTAIVGNVLFQEHLNSSWFVGSLLIIAGLTVLHTSSDETTSPNNQLNLQRSHETNKKNL